MAGRVGDRCPSEEGKGGGYMEGKGLVWAVGNGKVRVHACMQMRRVADRK